MVNENLPSLEQMIAQTRSISTPPLIYNRLNDAINHPRTSIKDIAQIISEDPGLTARILKLANSPLYGRSNVDSISRAVTLIGTREIRDLVLAASMRQTFEQISEKLLNLTLYWQHSVTCGVVARNIAFFLRETAIERFFVAGILHDIGQLVMCSLIPVTVTKMITLTKQEPKALCTVEKSFLGFDHAQLGAALLQTWKIPVNIVELVACHHTPSTSVQYPRDVAIVHLADLICQSLAYGGNSEIYVSPMDKVACDNLNLPLSAIEMIVKQSDLQLKDICAIMLEQQ